MIEEQYNRSIHTKEVQLGFAEKVTHFYLALICIVIALIFPLIHLKNYFTDNETSFISGEIMVTIVFAVIGLLLYKIQKKRLRFKVVQTNLKRDTLEKIIEEVGKELNWVPVQLTHNSFFAVTHPDFLISLGDQITVLFAEKCVFINSTGDVTRGPSILPTGRNRRNVECLIEAIEKATQST